MLVFLKQNFLHSITLLSNDHRNLLHFSGSVSQNTPSKINNLLSDIFPPDIGNTNRKPYYSKIHTHIFELKVLKNFSNLIDWSVKIEVWGWDEAALIIPRQPSLVTNFKLLQYYMVLKIFGRVLNICSSGLIILKMRRKLLADYVCLQEIN